MDPKNDAVAPRFSRFHLVAPLQRPTPTELTRQKHALTHRVESESPSAHPQLPPTMARGSKSSYTDKQKRQASHIEQGYEKKGVSKKTAEARAWATVNKTTGGGKKKQPKK